MAGFEAKEQNGINMISCPPRIDLEAQLETAIKSWLLLSTNIHILDFKHVFEFRKAAYRAILMFAKDLAGNNKKLYSINASEAMLRQMKDDGLTASIIPLKNLSDLTLPGKPAKTGLDVQFLNPFFEGTQVVISTQANTTAKPGRPYIKKADENLPMEIAGVISLTSTAFTGSIALCFQANVFLKIYENMVGEKHDQITQEIEDAAGELLNIIFGHAKTILNDKKGYKLEKAIPTVLSGEKLRLRHRAVPVFVLPFESSAGAFHIEIMVEHEKAQAAA